MMEPHMIENYIYSVFVIVINHVGFILIFSPFFQHLCTNSVNN